VATGWGFGFGTRARIIPVGRRSPDHVVPTRSDESPSDRDVGESSGARLKCRLRATGAAPTPACGGSACATRLARHPTTPTLRTSDRSVCRVSVRASGAERHSWTPTRRLDLEDKKASAWWTDAFRRGERCGVGGTACWSLGGAGSPGRVLVGAVGRCGKTRPAEAGEHTVDGWRACLESSQASRRASRQPSLRPSRQEGRVVVRRSDRGESADVVGLGRPRVNDRLPSSRPNLIKYSYMFHSS